MRVLLIGFTKIAYMPYMHFYIDELIKNNCEIDLLYWKRDNNGDIDPPNNISTHMFEYELEDSVPLFMKTKGFMKYRKYAKRLLVNKKFDLIIVLHSTPGILIYDLLKKYYTGKYILDYRDFTYENLSLYRKMIHKLVNNSYCTFVSSNGYRKCLPENGSIYTSHNLILSNTENRDRFKNRTKSKSVIKIRFWGFIRHQNINISIINNLSNDKRFELHYHGREQATARHLKEYCKNNGINNVYFHGEYKPNERLIFAKDTDFLHNMYDNDVKTINAMGNKFYDGIMLKIPQLCTKGSFMGDSVELSEVGKAFNPYSETLADDIYEYYKSMDSIKFETNCDLELNRIIKEYKIGTSILEKIANGGN